jgi:hypothetical protein
MIHELRTYTLKPKKAREYVKLMGEVGFKLRTEHSQCVGYWTTEVGELNQVVHLWGYEDFAHRARVREALAKDTAWQEKFVARARECVLRQENAVLIPANVWPFTPGSGNGIYELRYYRLHPGAVNEWLSIFGEGLEARAKYSTPVGVWSSELGGLNMVYHLWGYADLQVRADIRQRAMADPGWRETVKHLGPLMQRMATKILVPADFSPMK